MIHRLPALKVPGSSQDCEHKTATTESLTARHSPSTDGTSKREW
jgi:hypothetical protein